MNDKPCALKCISIQESVHKLHLLGLTYNLWISNSYLPTEISEAPTINFINTLKAIPLYNNTINLININMAQIREEFTGSLMDVSPCWWTLSFVFSLCSSSPTVPPSPVTVPGNVMYPVCCFIINLWTIKNGNKSIWTFVSYVQQIFDLFC